MDSLLSIVQMPAGIPVGTLSIGKAGATNAALLAVAILAGSRPELRRSCGSSEPRRPRKCSAKSFRPRRAADAKKEKSASRQNLTAAATDGLYRAMLSWPHHWSGSCDPLAFQGPGRSAMSRRAPKPS